MSRENRDVTRRPLECAPGGLESDVFVPVRDTTEKTNYVPLIGSIAQILASTVAIIVVATR